MYLIIEILFGAIALFAFASGCWLFCPAVWNAVSLKWHGIVTASERRELHGYLIEVGIGVSVVVTAIRAMFGVFAVLVVMAALSQAMAYDFCGDRYCPQGGAYAMPAKTTIDVSTRSGRKIAAAIARRPNVVADRIVPKAGTGGRNKGTVIVLRGMGGYLPFGGMDVLAAKIRAKGYRVIVSAPDYWASYHNERPKMIVGCSLGGTNALELARVVKNRPRVITIDPTRANRGAPRGIAAMNLYNSRNVLGAGYVRGAANYENNIGHIAMCSAAPVHAVVLAHL